MTIKEYQTAICKVVEAKYAIKNVDLALKVMEIVNPQMFDADEYNKALEDLVWNDEIVEVEFSLPNMEYRLKSVYFPKGTVVNIGL